MTSPGEHERIEQYKKITALVEPLQVIMDAKKKLEQSVFLSEEDQQMLDRINTTLVTVRAELLKLIGQIKEDQRMFATRSYYTLKEFAASTDDESVMKIYEEAKKMFREMITDFLKENEN
ncbi:MAG TPA: hypothetical protein VE978_17615 [Chitinophagales bacterium]|nr:hypothetical protein [Chitinophagales bacterium]